MKSLLAAALLATLTPSFALAVPAPAKPAAIEDTTTDASASTPACPNGSPLTGTVRDATDALIPGAVLQLDDSTPTQTSASDGHFTFPCIARGAHHLSITEDGFATQTLTLTAPHTAHLSITLALASVETNVDVDTATTAANSANTSGPTQTISGSRLQSLADDPDDLQRELTQLAGALGGNPANTTISVDGFEGTSALPPKSAIAYIVVNPDQFSAQYREPPFDGGRVEVYTKPGAKTFHGALFAVNGSPWMNARDPYSTSKAALGKQRYGFELSGPVTKKNSDFALTLEHRSIDDFAVINANTLDTSGNPVFISQNVATPQRLWLATARFDVQLGAKNTLIATYSANVNHLLNVGVGGNSLAETGYDSQTYEHMFRLSAVTTASAHLMHEARASFRFDGEIDNPNSLAPEVSVAGAVTSGGASIGAQRRREFNLEYDDDAILTTKSHTFKFGTVFNTWTDHYQFRTNVNGSYTFGGDLAAPVLGGAPGQTQTITGIEQYRRALLGLPGGAPTAYNNVAGTPTVRFTQVRDAAFFQDDYKLPHGVQISYGVRYYIQNDPLLLSSVVPRFGILWSPTKKGTWTLHAHAGMFNGRLGNDNYAEILREDGVHRITSTIYNPNCPAFNPATCNPFAGATAVHSIREFSPHIGNITWAAENIGGTRSFPHGWNLSADLYYGRIWNESITQNINAPLNGSPTGPRTGPADTDILQMQAASQGHVDAEFVGLEQHTLKHVQFFIGAVHVGLVDENNDDPFDAPQTTGNLAGELAPRNNQGAWNVFGNGTLTLPEKLQLSTNLQGNGDGHYNITTGLDNNGDGNFNDRPQYALPGTPTCVANPKANPCSYATRYGVLVASGGAGTLRRNEGVMPWKFYLDTNLQRAFALNSAKSDHPQKITLNLRAANILNHTNVTSIGGILGSPQFGESYAADPGRRIEAGLRYSF